VNLNLVVTKKHCRAEIYFSAGNKTENKKYFDYLFNMKLEIESEFGEPLQWERLDEKITCRIRAQLDEVNVFEKEDWPQMIDYLINTSEKMEAVFKKPVRKMNAYLKKKN
jgi:hypothetical protein